MLYYTQVRAAVGDYIDSIGSDNVEVCINHAKFLRKVAGDNTAVRVIKRCDQVVPEPLGNILNPGESK